MTLRYTAEETIETVMSTELNALANSDQAISSSSYSNDDTAERFLWVEIELYVAAQGVARTGGNLLEVALLPEVDDSNYADYDDENLFDNYVVASFKVDAATTARYFVKDKIQLPPGDYKWAVRNETGQALAATLNTLKMRAYSYTDT